MSAGQPESTLRDHQVALSEGEGGERVATAGEDDRKASFKAAPGGGVIGR